MTESSSIKEDKPFDRSIELRHIQRIFNRFNISLSTLSNRIHELLSTPPINAIHLLSNQKGGLEAFSKNVQATRQSIEDLFLEIDIDPKQLDRPDKKYTSRSAQAKLMLSNLQSGMTGCRNSIAFLIERGQPKLVKKKYLETAGGRFTLGELQKIYELLAGFESDDKKKIEAFLRKFQSNNDSLGKPLHQWEAPRPTATPPKPVDPPKKKDDVKKLIKKKPKGKPRTRPVTDFLKVLGKKSGAIKTPTRRSVAKEIAMHMEDGAYGFWYNQLSKLFPEIPFEQLEEELTTLQSELATIGIKLRGPFKNNRRYYIRFEWEVV